MEQFDTFPLQCRHIEHMHAGVWFRKNNHTRADQLLPQLLMEQFDTFPIQCRHIEHMHEGAWFRKKNIYFFKNCSCENLDNFSLIRLLYMH